MTENNDRFVDALNQGYICPSDAGPAWRAAWEAGVDMPLIEDLLSLTPGERLRLHQHTLDQLRSLNPLAQ